MQMMTRRNNQESIKEHVWCPVHCCKKTGEMNLDLILKKKAGLAGSLLPFRPSFFGSFLQRGKDRFGRLKLEILAPGVHHFLHG